MLTLRVQDSAGNVASKTLSTVKISPSNLETGIKLAVNSADTPNSKYPSASGGYNYTATVFDEFDNIIANWRVTSFEQSGQTTTVDITNNSSESALIISGVSSQTDGLGGIQFGL